MAMHRHPVADKKDRSIICCPPFDRELSEKRFRIGSPALVAALLYASKRGAKAAERSDRGAREGARE